MGAPAEPAAARPAVNKILPTAGNPFEPGLDGHLIRTICTRGYRPLLRVGDDTTHPPSPQGGNLTLNGPGNSLGTPQLLEALYTLDASKLPGCGSSPSRS